MSSKRAVNRVC